MNGMSFRNIVVLIILTAFGHCVMAQNQANPAFGVMIHYLPGKNQVPVIRPASFERFAIQMKDMGASYLIITLGQNNGQFIAPNRALTEICPFATSNEPRADIPLEVGQALARQKIGMVLYLPFRAPQDDPALMRCLGDVSEQSPTVAAFTANWSAIIRYWGEHYGSLAQGWWFDGVYNTTGMSAKDWSNICDASNAGAPGRWLAFNSGEGATRFDIKSAPCQNTMAGELNSLPDNKLLRSTSKQLRFHALTPLTQSWGRPGAARYTSADIRQAIALAEAGGGMLTLDMPVSGQLELDPVHVELVRQATRAVNKSGASADLGKLK